MGLKSHVTNPNKPLNKYKIRKITNEYATANSLSKPNKEKRNISAASLVPIPENEIGRKLNNLLTDIIAKVKNKEIGIAKDFAIIYHSICNLNRRCKIDMQTRFKNSENDHIWFLRSLGMDLTSL